MVLLLLNLWLATAWPYLAQLFIAWSTSGTLFLLFIHDVLNERKVKEFQP